MADCFQDDARVPLALHQRTALDASPAEPMAISGRSDRPYVRLFTHAPERASDIHPVVGEPDVAGIAAGDAGAEAA